MRTVAPIPEGCTTAPRVAQKVMLGDVCGLTQFGVNLTRLKPGTWSAHRHWHENEDEFVYIVEGEAVLIENDGETILRAGDCAGWKAGSPIGHCLVNKSNKDVVFIEIGTRAPDRTLPLSRRRPAHGQGRRQCAFHAQEWRKLSVRSSPPPAKRWGGVRGGGTNGWASQ